MSDLSKGRATEINVENAEETAKRLPDERALAVGTDGQSARRVRRREPGNRPLPSSSACLGRVVGQRQREHPGLGRLADEQVLGVWSEDTDDVRLGLDEFVERRQQDARVHVHCITSHTFTPDKSFKT